MRRYCNHCGMEVEFTEYSGDQFAVLRGNSHAVLWDNSHAVLRDNSHAVLRENSHAVLWGNSHAQCRSPYACGILQSVTAKCIGRHVGDKPIAPKEWLTAVGIEIKNQFVILYKSVNKDLSSKNGVIYKLKEHCVAPDWDADYKEECGKGLHLCPTVKQAAAFRDEKTYLACRVNIKDIAPLPAFAQYPDKIRVRACVPLYQCDIDGNEVK